MAIEVQPPETVLDIKAEIVCAYIASAGIITETERLLAKRGIQAKRQRINSIIRNDPQILEWTKSRYDEKYVKAIQARTESVSCEGIQRNNEISLRLAAKNKLRWDRELGKPAPDYKRLEAFAEFAKWTSIEFINLNLVYSRFRDGLHGKLIDQSQHKEETFNFGEGGLTAEQFAILRAHADRLKPTNRLANLPLAGQGDNGVVT